MQRTNGEKGRTLPFKRVSHIPYTLSSVLLPITYADTRASIHPSSLSALPPICLHEARNAGAGSVLVPPPHWHAVLDGAVGGLAAKAVALEDLRRIDGEQRMKARTGAGPTGCSRMPATTPLHVHYVMSMSGGEAAAGGGESDCD